jgi:hypothetical protein
MASAMRRLVTSTLALSLVAGTFLIAACGGDDKKDNSSQPTLTLQQPGTAQAPTGPTAGTTDQSGSKKSKRSRKRRSGSSGSNSNSQVTTPQQEPGKKEKLDKELAEALSKEGQRKISYEAARQVCREQPIKGIRQTYKVKKKGNEAIAKAVGRQYYPPDRARAAEKGCAKGLTER